jgi:hypothetical protein
LKYTITGHIREEQLFYMLYRRCIPERAVRLKHEFASGGWCNELCRKRVAIRIPVICEHAILSVDHEDLEIDQLIDVVHGNRCAGCDHGNPERRSTTFQAI